MKKNKIPSVGKIIFWFIVFYPLGFFFLFKRIKEKNLQQMEYRMYNPGGIRSNARDEWGNIVGEFNAQTRPQQADNALLGRRYKTITLAEIAGGILFSMSGIGNLIAGSDISSALISIGISLILIWLGYKRNIKITKYQLYLNYLTSFESTYVSDIAKYVHKDEITVRSDLADMIGCKMIDAKLSEDDRVILAGMRESSGGAAGTTRSGKRTITCPHCGAPTTIYPGRKNNCEYCDLSID